MRKILFFLLFSIPVTFFAEEVVVNDVTYNIDNSNHTAEIIKWSENCQGNVVIDESIDVEGNIYSVTSIGDQAFFGRIDMKSLFIPNTVTTIGSQAFENCISMTSIRLSDNITSIGSYAFYFCRDLPNISLPNKLEYLGDNAFNSCVGLKSIVIPKSLLSISEGAFFNCGSIESVTFHDKLQYIGSSAFDDCFNIQEIVIPNSVTTIGTRAFAACSRLSSLKVSNKITSIPEEAFAGCTNLKAIEIPAGVTYIGWCAFMSCESLEEINIPNSVTSIIGNAFNNCKSLKKVTLPKGLNDIYEGVFYGCENLTSITIPASVTSIWSEAFEACNKLTDVFCLATTPPNAENNAFSDSNWNKMTLHVPKSSLNQYRSTEPWSRFGKKVSIEDGNEEEPDPGPGPGPEPVKKCETPSITYKDGKLLFDCTTEGAVCHYSIENNDTKQGNGNEAVLTVAYTISVYATAEGYSDSETTIGTLCWLNTTPSADGSIEVVSTTVNEVKSQPVLIQSRNGEITISGAETGEDVRIYDLSGKLLAEGNTNSSKTFSTPLQKGEVAIIRISDKSVKIIVK